MIHVRKERDYFARVASVRSTLYALIRKAQDNKEMVVGIFYDIIEKAFDMLWKEGLLIKLEQLGIEGRILNWIKDFLIAVQVRVGSSYSKIYKIDNGTPQGSVCNPILFAKMSKWI